MTSSVYSQPQKQYSRTLLPYHPATSSSSSSSSTAPATMTTSMIDGTWEISIYMDGLDLRRVRVRGDLHVGGLMLKIVEGLEHDRDWSDYAIWWPKKNKWLVRMRSTLDQYDIQAGTLLHFLPVHSYLYVQLPDLQIIQMRVDFSADLFSVVIRMCRELGIRHPEELSLTLPLVKEDLKRDRGMAKVPRSKSHYDVLNSELNGKTTSRDSLSSTASSHFHRDSSNQSLPPSSAILRGSFYGNRNSGRFSLRKRRKSVNTLTRTISTPLSPDFVNGTLSRSTFDANTTSVLTRGSTGSLYPLSGRHDLVNSPPVTAREAFEVLPRPKNLSEKARCNAGWLDSSKSLMEQSVLPSSLVLLKFKFYSFYDLNPSHDAARINQLYSQAKWSILTEELECTREEMVAFAALQLHIQRLQNPASPGRHDLTLVSSQRDDDYDLCRTPEDIIDAALTDLQMSLEGSTLNFPAPFSSRARLALGGRSTSHGCQSGYDCSTIRRSDGLPSANSAYSISSSSTSPFYLSSSCSSRYDFSNGTLAAPRRDDVDRSTPSTAQVDITTVPELRGCLRFYRPKRFFLKSYKKQPFLFRDLTLCMFRTVNDQKPIWSLELKGCEVTSEVLLSGRKYIIKLMVPLSRGADEIWFKMDDEEQYVNWLAGMRLACRGRTMADVPSFRDESGNIRDKMSMLRAGKDYQARHDGSNNNIDPRRCPAEGTGNGRTVQRSNGTAEDNGYDHLGPKELPTASDFRPSSFVRRDSRRRSFLDLFRRDRENSESDLADGIGADGTILRSKVKGREGGRPMKNGTGHESEGSSYHSERHSSTESVASIPKSLRGSRGRLYGDAALQDFLAPRFCRRSKLKQLLHRISEAVEEMRDVTALESKLAYLKAWQSLPDFGYSYFVIKVKGSKKEDILVLTPLKIALLEGGSHEVLKRWRYQDLHSWSVNWEVKQVMIEFEEDEMIFQCCSSDCKVIHEFIGGYIFLSMRSPEHNHRLNHELFHKLTGGWT